MYEGLKSRFPKTVELPGALLPQEIGTEYLVRHRFLTESENRMFQIGVGILSINHTGYAGFSEFISDCQLVVKVAKSIGLLSRVDRMGLRYINKGLLDRPLEQIIQLKVTAPTIIENSAKAHLCQWIGEFSGVGMLSSTIAWPVIEEDIFSFVLDFDHFYEPKASLKPSQLIDWLHKAHENIYQVFKSSLCEDYFAYLREGVGR